ncbi:hypothetical protein Moror_13349 [Moniliophthora roreri MCA 2997]|uniref:Uncharacterized protein n=2 Tax=Moniliophthora roreri TaxID=221103 RepID=V2WSQ3_MONRO|nr:hypothetical protein Moror_13349 [Moniliophthora roreri MCA 2997]KAI3619933.1 hypothetical protein WG66_002611 [Moniliophthora roreri]
MSFFPSPSNLIIEDGNFTAVARDQYNNHIEGTLVQYLGQAERERTVWDEYTRVPVGKVYIKRTISVTDVRRQVTLPDYQHWRGVDALRLINIASIHGEDRDSEFVYVRYDGQDASEAFRRDFEQFSRSRNVHTAQLFGYNGGQFSLPALIFYDALVPVAYIWERNDFSPLIFTYLSHQLGVVPIANRNLDFGEVWVNPRTGTLCVGPYVEYSSGSRVLVDYTEEDQISTGYREYPFLSLQTYNDSNAILDLLVQTHGRTATLGAICESSNHVMERVADEDLVFMLSSLLGGVYSRTRREIIARWPKMMNERHYRPYRVDGVPEWVEVQPSRRHNTSIRFEVTPSDIKHLQNREFDVDYQPCSGRKRKICAYAWPTQAHSVLGERGSQEEWKGYSLLRGFSIHFQGRNEQLSPRWSNFLADKVYLFIRAIPSPSACRSVWNAWLQKPKYFWSFDRAGNEEIPEAVRCSLGLPSFTTRFQIRYQMWPHIAYTAIRQLHILKGFDPLTRDLARSLDLPLLETVRDETRFEEIKAQSIQFEPMDVDSNLVVLPSTVTVDVAEDAMDPLLKTVGDETRLEVIKDFQLMDVDSELTVSLSTLTVDVEEDAMDID